jgi:hypothetical protein
MTSGACSSPLSSYSSSDNDDVPASNPIQAPAQDMQYQTPPPTPVPHSPAGNVPPTNPSVGLRTGTITNPSEGLRTGTIILSRVVAPKSMLAKALRNGVRDIVMNLQGLVISETNQVHRCPDFSRGTPTLIHMQQQNTNTHTGLGFQEIVWNGIDDILQRFGIAATIGERKWLQTVAQQVLTNSFVAPSRTSSNMTPNCTVLLH